MYSPQINQNLNQGGGGEGDGGGPTPGPTDPYAGLGYSSANFGLGKETIGDFVNKDAVMDYEADAYNVGRTPLGQLSRFGVGIIEALKNVPTPVNLIRKGIEFTKQRAAEKAAAEAAAAEARRQETRAIQARINRDPRGYDGSRGPSASPYGGGGGGLHSDYADGGLVTMFVEKR